MKKLAPRLAILVPLLACAATAAAQGPAPDARPVLRTARVEEGAIRIDGRLDEAAWLAVEAGTGFTQREPSDGSPASEPTEVRVLYSSHAVYVGVRAYDSEPEGIYAALARRDQRAQSDEVSVYLDTYHDRRTAFEFAVTPRGAIRDVYHANDGWESDASWDPVWEVETSRDAEGWSAEFRIPLTQLRFDEGKETWGLQVYRRIHRKAEEVYWAPNSKNSSGFASLFGTLEGLNGLSQPVRLELRPYTVASERRRPPGSGSLYAPERRGRVSAGLDVKYGLTSDFTLDLTVNPDFGQVEADPAVVNLTAFETFFPEKRPFFVEGSGLFGVFLPQGQPFYSRRVGRRPQGFAPPPSDGTVEIPDATTILAAAKVTGKSASGLGLGVLSALTAEEQGVLRDSVGIVVDEVPVEPRTHHFVLRMEQDFRQGSHTIGGMATAVNRDLPGNLDFLPRAAYSLTLDGAHRWKQNTYAIRWQLAGSHVRGSEAAISAVQQSALHYFQRPDAEHVELDTTRTSLSGTGMRLTAGKEAGFWRPWLLLARVSPGFDINDAGFQFQGDVEIVRFGADYVRPRLAGPVRSYDVGVSLHHVTTAGGETKEMTLPFTFASATFRNNWSVLLNPVNVVGTTYCVECLRGGPALRHDPFRVHFLRVSTDRRKPLSLDFNSLYVRSLETGGRRATASPTLTLRPSPLLNGSVQVRYETVRDPVQWVTRRTGLDTTRHIVAEIEQRTLNLTTRLNWTLSRTLSAELYAQGFVSAGAYRDFKEVTAARAPEFADRFRWYRQELSCGGDGRCSVDLNRDGTSDFSFPRPDFKSRQLRSTAVLRWEYRPGSTLFLAWQHGRRSVLPTGDYRGLSDLRGLFDLDSDNTLLVKANYWLTF